MRITSSAPAFQPKGGGQIRAGLAAQAPPPSAHILLPCKARQPAPLSPRLPDPPDGGSAPGSAPALRTQREPSPHQVGASRVVSSGRYDGPAGTGGRPHGWDVGASLGRESRCGFGAAMWLGSHRDSGGDRAAGDCSGLWEPVVLGQRKTVGSLGCGVPSPELRCRESGRGLCPLPWWTVPCHVRLGQKTALSGPMRSLQNIFVLGQGRGMDGVTPSRTHRSCVPGICPFVPVAWGRSAKGPVGSPLGGSALGAGPETLALLFPSPPATLAAQRQVTASDEVGSLGGIWHCQPQGP